MIRLYAGLGFLAGALASAIYNDPWDRVLLTGIVTAVLSALLAIVMLVRQTQRQRRREVREVVRQNQRWMDEERQRIDAIRRASR